MKKVFRIVGSSYIAGFEANSQVSFDANRPFFDNSYSETLDTNLYDSNQN